MSLVRGRADFAVLLYPAYLTAAGKSDLRPEIHVSYLNRPSKRIRPTVKRHPSRAYQAPGSYPCGPVVCRLCREAPWGWRPVLDFRFGFPVAVRQITVWSLSCITKQTHGRTDAAAAEV